LKTSGGFLSGGLSRSLWLVVVSVALVLSAWSLFWTARHFGVPGPLALACAAAFDGIAVLASDYAVRHISAGTRGRGLARFTTLVFVGTSVTLNSEHAVLAHYPPAAALMFAMPSVAALLALEIHFRWKHSGLRPPVAQKPELPSFHPLTWVFHPGEAWQQVKASVEPGVNRPELVPPVPELFTVVPEVPASALPELSGNSSATRSGGSAAGRDLGIVGDPRAVRAWARDHGIEVGAHGPIPGHVERAWQQAVASANGHGPA
jgi:hypothetical protein